MLATSLLLIVAVLSCLVVAPTPASAEWFVDLFGGAAFTQKEDVRIKDTLLLDAGGSTFSVSNVTFEDLKFDKSLVFGGRAGYWSEAAPYVGIGLDVFHFRPNINSQNVRASGTVSDPGGLLCGIPGSCVQSISGVPVPDIDIRVTAITADVFLRLSLLNSEDFPKGRLQPYVSFGPGVFITQVRATGGVDETDTSFGVQAGGGVAFHIIKNLALFAEYRFTHVNPDVKINGLRFETDLNTHHLIGGISFRFP